MNTMGISVSEVIAAAGTKPYGFMPFFPNVGIGGHCIPVDPLYLQKNAIDNGMISRYIKLSEELNHEMPKYCVEGLEALYGKLNSKHVLVVGVSYKPDISDTRESPAEFVVKELEKKGAKVSWHDPLVESFNGQSSASIAGDYDLALVLVKHQVLDMSSWSSKPVYCVNSTALEPEWIPILGSSRGK
jgi:UDP-N-acetyl-D-glucosamine dehydrogenase